MAVLMIFYTSANDSPAIHVAIPVQDEIELLPACIDALRRQEGVRLTTWFCVNQPEDWWADPEQRVICEANRVCLRMLREIVDLDVQILDRSSPGQGWPPKRGGVGRARKELMDTISTQAAQNELIVSLDADTIVPPDYLRCVAEAFATHPSACGMAARYFHPLVEDDTVSRAMLGYEIYMRLYVLNLWRIESPYSFTALGSALALPVRTYCQVGGITPRTTGEDFYFLQKLTKQGRVLHWSDVAVAPATRASVRVPVGTGQAILAACEGKHLDRYPLYPAKLFDHVRETTDAFPDLFDRIVKTPLDSFLKSRMNTDDLWQPLRDNNKTPDRFVRACHERLDGLRILQYLKDAYRRDPGDDTTVLRRWLLDYGGAFPDVAAEADRWAYELRQAKLSEIDTNGLDQVRLMLCRMEDHYRRQDFLRD